MKSCNVVSLTRVTSINTQNVEYDKVFNAILSNYQFLNFETALNPDMKNKVYDFLKTFVTDIVYLHNEIAHDLTLDLQYVVVNNEFEISVNFIQTGQSLESKLFDLAIEYFDKYEEYINDNELTGTIFVDFNTMTKNENLHVITKYSDGTVVDNGKERQ